MTAPNVQITRSSRSWLARGLVLAGAIAVGLWLHLRTADHLASIQALAQQDPAAARAQLAWVFRALAIGLFGGIALIGVAMIASCRRAIRLGQFPPPGTWSLGAVRVWHGEPARRLARVLLVLAVALVICSLAGSAISWYAAQRLLACRAG